MSPRSRPGTLTVEGLAMQGGKGGRWRVCGPSQKTLGSRAMWSSRHMSSSRATSPVGSRAALCGHLPRSPSWSADASIPVMQLIKVRNYASCLVSRVTPIQTASRNCTGDGGGPFGFGDQVADPKPPQAAAVKSRGGERCGKVGAMIPAGMVERGERKRTVAEVSKAY